MLTRSGHNAPMRTRRSKALWAVAALLLVNAALLLAQPGLALPGSLGSYFFGPQLVRNKAGGTLTLLERDATLVQIAVAPTASITLGGRPVAYADLRRGMVATVIRDGDAPASEVRATRR